MDARPVCQGLCSPTANMSVVIVWKTFLFLVCLNFAFLRRRWVHALDSLRSRVQVHQHTGVFHMCMQRGLGTNCSGGGTPTGKQHLYRWTRMEKSTTKTWGLSLCLMKHLICFCTQTLLNVWSIRLSAGQTPTAPIWLGPTTVPATVDTDWTTWKW